MLKKTIFLLFLLCPFGALFAQGANTFEADTARANALWNEAVVLAGASQFQQVLGKMDSAEILYARSLGTESVEIAKIFFGKAVCHFNLAEYAPSAGYFQRCLDIRERRLGKVHKDVAICLIGLGNIHNKTGEYARAAECFEQYRSVMIEISGPETPEIARAEMSLGNVYLLQGDLGRSETKYRECLDLQTKLLPPNHLDFAKTYQAIATLLQRRGDYVGAIAYCHKALDVLLKTYPPDAGPLADVYSQTGATYANLGDTQKAKEYLQKALGILLQTVGPDHPDVAAFYASLAGVYGVQGDPARALELSLKAADIYVQKFGNDHHELARIYSNAGEFCRRTGDTERALRYLSEALAICQKKLTSYIGNLPSIHLNLGVVHQQRGDYDAALEHYAAAHAFLQEHNPEHPEIAIILANKAALLALKGEYRPALLQYQEALTIRQRIFGAKHAAVADIYSNMLEVCRLGGMFAEGTHYADSALAALNYGGESDFDRVHSVPTLLQVLLNKGAFYFAWFQQDALEIQLRTARQAFAAAAQAVAYQDRYLENPDSKFTLSADAGKVAAGGIAVAHGLYVRTDSLHYAHEAFAYAQKSKALVLYGSMQEAKAVRFAGLPDSVLERERQLRVELAYLERKRQELLSSGTSETDSAALAIGTRIFELRQRYSDLTKHLERTFPNYHRLRYDRSTATVREVQEHLLRAGQTLVEYVVGDSSLFVFVVGKQTFLVREIPQDFPLETWVTDLRAAMTTNRSTAAALYCDRAYHLYQKLLAPIQEYLTEELVFVPDGVLNYLPFEALLTQMPAKPARFRTHDYLLHQHRISYGYSATLLREMQEKRYQQTPTEHLLALAPYYSGDSALLAELPTLTLRKKRRALRHSGGEVYGIRRIMGGDVLHGQAANKEHFLQIAGKYRILHLATHGQANERVGDYSLLAFAETADSTDDNLLYVRDIYNLPLDADLVTLSACETGLGKLQRGEGIISVARAFAYAGASSIVTALWDVDDEHAKELMLVFYKELRKGSSKSEALQTAKRSLAKRLGSHPFFWAAFIGIGDMRPLPQLKN